MDEKLLAYRKQKERKEKWENMFQRFQHAFTNTLLMFANACQPQLLNLYEAEDTNESEDMKENEADEDLSQTEAADEDLWDYFKYFAVWAALFGIFLYLEFGAIYFIVSLLFLMFMNTRTKPKVDGEASAYSVFNKNCEPILGTFGGEQIEENLRSGKIL